MATGKLRKRKHLNSGTSKPTLTASLSPSVRQQMARCCGTCLETGRDIRKLATVEGFKQVSVLISDQAGRILWVNEGFERLSGYSPADATGRMPSELLGSPLTEANAVARIAEAVKARLPFSGMIANRNKAGESYWVEIEIQPLFSARGEHLGFMEVQTDVTRLKRAMSELGDHAARIETMSELANIGEWSFDLETRTPYWSRQVCRIHELGETVQPTPALVQTLYTTETISQINKAIVTSIRKRGPVDLEVPMTTVRGQSRVLHFHATPVFHGGKVTGVTGAIRDVTEAARSSLALAQSRQRLELAIDNAQIGLWDWESDSRSFHTHGSWWQNVGFVAVDGVPIDQMTLDHIHPDDHQHVIAGRSLFREGKQQGINHEFRFHDAHGAWRWINSIGRATAWDEAGRPLKASGVFIDIHEKKLASDRISHAASHDALTGLVNRTELKNRVDSTLAGDKKGVCLFLVDLDGFKLVNDKHGHAAGDALLVEVGKRLKQIVREDDLVARLGGDEFAIVISTRDDVAANSRAIAARIVEELSRPFIHDNRQMRVGASVGIAFAPDHGMDYDQLIGHADKALYDIKSSGKNAFRFYDAALEHMLRERNELEEDLRGAHTRGELELHYQTQVNLWSGEVMGTEALLRWRHPTRGLVPPATFIPIAEETGLIVDIGNWVLERACLDAVSWAKPWPVAVNLSVGQLGKTDLADYVARLLLQTGLPARRLEIEVTESILIGEDDALLADLRRLHDMGVKLALDDFGTGYASLSYLKKLPFSKVKIDRGFVADVETNKQSAAIVAAIVNMSRLLDMEAVAEGVETKAQAALLSAAGCRIGQGWLFSKPVPGASLFPSATDSKKLA